MIDSLKICAAFLILHLLSKYFCSHFSGSLSSRADGFQPCFSLPLASRAISARRTEEGIAAPSLIGAIALQSICLCCWEEEEEEQGLASPARQEDAGGGCHPGRDGAWDPLPSPRTRVWLYLSLGSQAALSLHSL